VPNKFRVVAPLLAVALVGACTGDPAPPASGDPDGTTLVLAVAEEPAALNPLAGYAPNGAAKIFDGLVEHEENRSLRPALADALPEPAADGRSWTVRLRPGVTFSDGTPFEAQDVVATYQAVLDPARESPVRQRFAMLAGVTALDASTVRFDLTAPYSPFPELLVLGILPSEALAAPELPDPPVGTGPYRLTEWRRGTSMVLEANESYYDGAPAITKVTVEFIPDDETRAARLREGKLDGAALPPELANEFENTDGLQLVAHSAADVRAIALPSGPVTGDPALRLALNHAVDREAIVAGTLAGRGRVAYTPMPDVLAEFVEPDATYDHDLTQALDLLATAGWVPGAGGIRTKNGVLAQFTVRYVDGDSIAAGLAEAFANDARALGVQVDPEAVPADELTGPAVIGFGNPFDPDPALYPLLHSAVGDYSDATVDSALVTGRTATDPAQRATAYRRLQRAWLTAPSMVVLAAPQHTYVIRESWDGYEPVVDAASADFTWGAWWNLQTWTPR
jgi:peptide/nickel transport system substrate-binding protein